ncbi:hypothetical protein [Azospirillum lipoferum]|uniref:hypothetical protein n=1 Tax=Azospirillum lipoferum TaxID=193 RepID=UPI00139645AD|nr:hypothetical protein [Azospirillum lipoferum]
MIEGNPSVFATLMSAIIAASVAIIVFALTQFITNRRERSKLLTQKLEELYILVNEVFEKNADRCERYKAASLGDEDALGYFIKTHSTEVYGHSRAKKIIMYIRLYFPELTYVHQHAFKAEAKVNHALYKIHTGSMESFDKIFELSGAFGQLMRLMEKEIIENYAKLVRAN